MNQHSPGHHHDGIAELLDLDAAVTRPQLLETMAWLQQRSTELPVARILDVGAGTGNGSLALAEYFPEAEVLAVDLSAAMLQRVQERAEANNLAARISTNKMNLDEPWPELGTFQLVWAAASLHEVADPAAAFRQLFQLLQPGGLIAVAELGAPPKFLTDDAGAGLEARLHNALSQVSAGQNNHPDWSEDLAAVGFTSIEIRATPIDQPLPAAGLGGRYADAYFRRIYPAVHPRLTATDQQQLEALLCESDASSLQRRGDLRLSATRTVWTAHRPRL